MKFGILEPSNTGLLTTMSAKTNKKSSIQTRPPVVVILGHVDHGKTKLLDYIRKTNVAEKEAGGITQHIGAYDIERQDKKITFIDTPGHEAFSSIRSRGAKAADIAILVVAGEEGVKPQTKEAIEHIKKAGIPAVIAINKIDKPEANPEKVKRELAKNNVLVESLGGDVPSVNISAKSGEGINDLLEIINLVAEMEEIKAGFQGPASGVVLESYLDSRRGPTATLLVLDGTLKINDWAWIGTTYGKIKSMEDFLGNEIKEAPPSKPVVVTGIYKVSEVGERFEVKNSEKEAKEKSGEELRKTTSEIQKPSSFEEVSGKKIFNIILKTDVLGSLEALRESLGKIESDEIGFKIIKDDAGAIDESDIKLAYSTKSEIFGFRTKLLDSRLEELAKRFNIRITISDIIYEILDKIKERASKLLEPEIIKKDLGKLEILAVFKKTSRGLIVGGKVTSGQVKNKALVNILREGKIANSGRIIQLQKNKKDVDEVSKGDECGILYEGEGEIKEGDVLEIFEEERKKRFL